MEEIDVCYHHSDHDGFCAAAIVQARNNISLGYSKVITPSDLLNTCTDRVVAMVDFSMEKSKMQRIKEIAKRFIWIDHHESASVCTELKLEGIFSIEKAGCELTWDFFRGSEPVPDSVKYVGDRDMWEFNYPETKLYGYGLNVTKNVENPSSDIWKRLLSSNDYTESILSAGEIVGRVVDTDTTWTERLNLFRGGRLFVINVTSNVSEIASNILNKNGHDCLVMAWQMSKKGLRISFRGEGAGENAEHLGNLLNLRGGGHAEAAGLHIPLTHPKMWSILKGLYEESKPVR